MDVEPRKIVEEFSNAGHYFQIEELDPPILKGATMRTHRLWIDGDPARGAQYHHSLEFARKEAEYRALSTHISRIAWLESRVRSLEAALARAGLSQEIG